MVFGLLLSFGTLYLGDPNLLVSCPDNYLSSLVITLWFNINKLIEVGSPDVTWVRMLHVLGRVSNNPAQVDGLERLNLAQKNKHTISKNTHNWLFLL